MKITRMWEIILVLLLIAVVSGFGASTDGFIDIYNLSDSTFNYSEKALIALPMAISGVMLLRSGIETRGHGLEEIQDALRR